MISRLYSALKGFILPKLRFALTSIIATAFDYILYLILFYFFFSTELSNIISYSLAVILNFLLQKKYVFQLKNEVKKTFVISMLFSFLGLIFSTGMLSYLNKLDFFYTYQFFTKMLVTGIIFFYNFYTKKFAFERA